MQVLLPALFEALSATSDKVVLEALGVLVSQPSAQAVCQTSIDECMGAPSCCPVEPGLDLVALAPDLTCHCPLAAVQHDDAPCPHHSCPLNPSRSCLSGV